MTAQPDARLSAHGLSLGYEGRRVVEDLSLEVADGQITSVIGPNGSGKSTLLKGLGRLLPAQSGEVRLDGIPLGRQSTRHIATQLSVLPQTPSAPSGLTVADLVSRGRHPRQKWYQQFSAADERIVMDALGATGIADLADVAIDDLSGGQRQRAWISMILAQETGILLLDEPTTFLDLAHQVEVLELIRSLNRDHGRTIVMVLHDISLAARYSDRIIAMRDGRIVAEGTPVEVVTPSSLLAIFGLRAEVIHEPTEGRPHVIPLGIEDLARSGLSTRV